MKKMLLVAAALFAVNVAFAETKTTSFAYSSTVVPDSLTTTVYEQEGITLTHGPATVSSKRAEKHYLYSWKSGSNVSGYEGWIECNDNPRNDDGTGAGVSTLPTHGAFALYEPKYDGTLAVAGVFNNNKDVIIAEVDADGGITLLTSSVTTSGEMTVQDNGSFRFASKLYGDVSFPVKAGLKYYTYLSDSKMSFAGFSYTYEEPAAEAVADSLTTADVNILEVGKTYVLGESYAQYKVKFTAEKDGFLTITPSQKVSQTSFKINGSNLASNNYTQVYINGVKSGGIDKKGMAAGSYFEGTFSCSGTPSEDNVYSLTVSYEEGVPYSPLAMTLANPVNGGEWSGAAQYKTYGTKGVPHFEFSSLIAKDVVASIKIGDKVYSPVTCTVDTYYAKLDITGMPDTMNVAIADGLIKAGDTFTLTLSGIADKEFAANTLADTTFTYTLASTACTGVTPAASTSRSVLPEEVVFSFDGKVLADAAKFYMVNLFNNDTINLAGEVVDGTTVKITVPAWEGLLPKKYNVVAEGVTDENGKAITYGTETGKLIVSYGTSNGVFKPTVSPENYAEVKSLSEFTLTFPAPVVFDDSKATAAAEVVLYEDYNYVTIEGLELTMEVNEEDPCIVNVKLNKAITAAGTYRLSIPQKMFWAKEYYDENDLSTATYAYYNPSVTCTYEVSALKPVEVTPASGATVAALESVTLTFDENVAFNADTTVVVLTNDPLAWTQDTVATGKLYAGNDLMNVVVRLDAPIDSTGEFTLIVPAKAIWGSTTGENFTKALSYYYNVNPLQIAVDSLNTLIAEAEAWRATLNANDEMHAQVIGMMDGENGMIAAAKAMAAEPTSLEAVNGMIFDVNSFLGQYKVMIEQYDAKVAAQAVIDEANALIASCGENYTDECGLKSAISAASEAITSLNLGDGTLAELNAAVETVKVKMEAFYAENGLVVTGTYYMKNVGSGKFLAGGNRWGTQTSLATHGLDVIVTRLSSGKYTFDSNVYTSGKHYVNDYIDAAYVEWNVTPLENGNYALSMDGTNYIGYDGETTVASLTLTDVTEANAQWQFITKAELVAGLSEARHDNPMDATFFIVGQNFNRADANRNAAWQGSPAFGGGDHTNWCGEKWNANFDIYQILTDIPNGYYTLTAQAFYRAGNGGTTETACNAYLYANDQDTAIVNILSEAGNEAITGNTSDVEGYGLVPNNMETAGIAFAAGLYNNSLDVKVTDGTLRIGVKKETLIDYDWTIFDNFELTYLGKYTAEAQKVVDSLATVIAAGQETVASYEEYTDNAGLVALLEKAATLDPEGGNTVAELEEAITNIHAAIEIFVKENVIAAGTYWLKNVAADNFVVAGESYGTCAVYGKHGMDFEITKNSDGTFAIDSKLSNGGDSHYFGASGWMDGAMTGWTIAQMPEGTYTLTADGVNYLGYNSESNVVATNLTDNTAAAAQWMLLTKEDMVATLDGATAENPADATFFISCPNFGRNDTRFSTAWQGSPARGGNNDNMCAEKWNCTFDVYQDLTGLPNGYYTVSVQGFYRAGWGGTTDETRNSMFYANSDSVALVSINSEAGNSAFAYEGNNVSDVEGLGIVPNNMATASTGFTAGLYNNSLTVKVTDGTLRIGVAKTALIDGDWTIFDNFELTYLGKYDPVNGKPMSYDFSCAAWGGHTTDLTVAIGADAVETINNVALGTVTIDGTTVEGFLVQAGTTWLKRGGKDGFYQMNGGGRMVAVQDLVAGQTVTMYGHYGNADFALTLVENGVAVADEANTTAGSVYTYKVVADGTLAVYMARYGYLDSITISAPKTVAYLCGATETTEAIYTALVNAGYAVTPMNYDDVTLTEEIVANDFAGKYDLVVLAGNTGSGTNLAKSANLLLGKVNVLSTKSFWYKHYGTNGTNPGTADAPSLNMTKVATYAAHPIYNGIEGDEFAVFVEHADERTTGRYLQGNGSFNNGVEQVTLGTANGDNCIGEAWVDGYGYVIIPVDGAQPAGYLTADGEALYANAAAYLIAGEAYEAPVVDVTGITLDQDAIELNEGETATIEATVTPENATDKTVTWTSSDENVATVVNGVVTAVAGGEAVITAQVGEFTATCTVTVVANGIESIHTDNVQWPADIYDLTGRMVKKGATSLEGLNKGIYLINGKKHLVK